MSISSRPADSYNPLYFLASVGAGGSRRSGCERRTASAGENGMITIRPAQWSAVAMITVFL